MSCYYCGHDPKSAETLPRCPSCGALQPAPANAMEVRSKLQTYNALSVSINGANLVQHDDVMIVKRNPAREKPIQDREHVSCCGVCSEPQCCWCDPDVAP